MKFINESLEDFLKAKSEEEILNDLEDKTLKEKIKISLLSKDRYYLDKFINELKTLPDNQIISISLDLLFYHNSLFKNLIKDIINKSNIINLPYKEFGQYIFPDKKITYFHSESREYEYKNNRKIYDLSGNESSYLRTKDYVILLENDKPIGFAKGSNAASSVIIGTRIGWVYFY